MSLRIHSHMDVSSESTCDECKNALDEGEKVFCSACHGDPPIPGWDVWLRDLADDLQRGISPTLLIRRIVHRREDWA